MSSGKSYEERHQDGLAVIKRMGEGPVKSTGNDDPPRVARSMVRKLGALGSFNTNNVLGDVWSRPQLSRRDRSLVVITVLMTVQSKEELEYHLKVALNHGVKREEIQEAILHQAGYGGFPRAMPAQRVYDSVLREIDGLKPTDRLPERKAAAKLSDMERRERGTDVRTTLTGGKSNKDPNIEFESMSKALGVVGEKALEFAFGEIWSRTEMSRRDRSLVVISILTVLGRNDELDFHIQGGLNHGLTEEEILEIMVQMIIYGGFPAAVQGTRVARKVFKRMKKLNTQKTSGLAKSERGNDNNNNNNKSDVYKTSFETYVNQLQTIKEFAYENELPLSDDARAWYDAIDHVGSNLINNCKWWKEAKAQDGWSYKGNTMRTQMPIHYVTGKRAPWYMEYVSSPDQKESIWAIYMGPFTSNGARRIGTGQGGAISSLFDLCTGHVASSYLQNPSPTAYIHVDMKKPARSIPGVFKLHAYVDRIEGKKVYVKSTISNGDTGVVYDACEAMMVDVSGKRGVVGDDLKKSNKGTYGDGSKL